MADNELIQRDEMPADEHVPVEAPPASVHADLVRDLLPTLTRDMETRLHGLALHAYQDALADRSEWESRLTLWDDQYYGVTGEKDFPWPGASNLHVPLTMLGIETLKPRLIESVLGSEPMIYVIPTEAMDAERQVRTELFLNWRLHAALPLAELVSTSAHLFLTPGTVVAKTIWRVERTRRRSVRSFPAQTPVDDILQSLLGTQVPAELVSAGPMRWTGTRPASPQGGPPLTVELQVRLEDEMLHVQIEQDDVRERPDVRLIEPIDFFMPSNAGHDLQRMPWCIERLYLTEDDLRRMVRLGRFRADVVDALLRTRTPTGQDTAADAQTYRDTQAEREGVAADAADAQADTYLILEDYRRDDIDEDGFEEEIVQWICPALPGRLLGWDYVDNVYAHGRRPYRIGRYHPIPFRAYGLSFPEIVRNLQEEINTIHNQRVDSGTLGNLPWFLYRGAATYNPTQYPLKPGAGIPIDNPQTDIVFPRTQFSPVFGQNEEALDYQYFERLTGLTDLSLGRQPSRVGATRTATGVVSLLSESGLRFKTAMEAFQRFWVGIAEDVLALDQQYLPPGLEFRVTGRLPEVLRLTSRADIAGAFDLRLSATSESVNKQLLREDAMTVMQLLIAPAGLQLGLVGVKGIRRAYTDLLRAFGKDPDFYLEVPSPTIVHTSEEELAMLVAGHDIRPSMGENVSAHLQDHMLQRRDPVVQMILGPTGMQRLDAHIRETTELAQMQALAASTGGARDGASPMGAQGAQAGNAVIGRTAPAMAGPSTTSSAVPPGPPGMVPPST